MRLHWTTEQIAPARRAEYWRAAVCDAFLAMTPRIERSSDFAARLDHLPLERLSLNRVVAPRHGVQRTPLDLSRGGPDLVFVNLNRRGRGRVGQFGREQLGQPGELMLIDSAAPYRIELVDGGELLSLALPAALLERRAPQWREQVGRPLVANLPARLLAAQLDVLAQCGDTAVSTDEAVVVADHLLALVAAALSPAAVGVAGLALLRRLRLAIARRFDDPAFGPGPAAQEAGVSLRSLHAAFAAAGSSFGRELLEYRLQRARHGLGGGRGERVAEVARACGFVSAEHFSRRFRARFGCTAERCRRDALGA